MTLRCVFHVSPAATTAPKIERRPMLTLIDLDVDYVDEPHPRGRSSETWSRARGWASED